jgi:uncharacterized protein YecE (DUF72 family)
MIRVGIGGWVFKPWRGAFYPPDLPAARELEFASRKLTTIEINGTFYRTQTPTSFRKWAAETPDDFVFSLKAPRAATHRRLLAEAGESIERFLASGVLELRHKLGPILWQLHPAKRFDADDMAAFLALLPHRVEGCSIQNVVEVRHASFRDGAFIEMARRHSVAIALVDSDKHTLIADVTGDVVYMRLQKTSEEAETGYTGRMLDIWAKRTLAFAQGGVADDLPAVAGKAPAKRKRDVFIYMIAGAKVRAPAAAMALLERLK